MSQSNYYNNPSQWGDYQFTTLEEIVNNYLSGRDADDYTSTTPRHQVLYQAKRGIRELYYDVARTIKGIELEIGNTLSITVPPDFVGLVRMSWVDEYGKLHPMATDTSVAIAEVYLQDNEFQILFDDQGNPLTAGTVFENSRRPEIRQYDFCEGFVPNKDNSKSFPNGSFSFDKSNGLIQFSSDIQGKSVVLEYISDGLYDSEIKLHKFVEDALYNYIYHELIKNRRNVPANEKMRARKEYFNSRRIAKKRINVLSKEDLLQTFKGANRWVK